jgi:hypothetical protein
MKEEALMEDLMEIQMETLMEALTVGLDQMAGRRVA